MKTYEEYLDAKRKYYFYPTKHNRIVLQEMEADIIASSWQVKLNSFENDKDIQKAIGCEHCKKGGLDVRAICKAAHQIFFMKNPIYIRRFANGHIFCMNYIDAKSNIKDIK